MKGEGMVPVLDLKVAVKENQLVHEYYEKPCAAKMVIPYSSAHSRKMKVIVFCRDKETLSSIDSVRIL